MNFHGRGSLTRAWARSLIVGVTLLWVAGVIGSGLVLKRVIDSTSDHELQESGAVLMSLLTHTDDAQFAAIVGRTLSEPGESDGPVRYAFVIRDGTGQVLLQSHNAFAQLAAAPLRAGLSDADGWRVMTLVDPERTRYLHVADPLAERNDELVTAMLGLMVPLLALLGFITYIVFRASRSLVQQVERTASAVSNQDPQALRMLPLNGVVTEMRPAVEATNRLLRRLADAFEAERAFTYNSAHELRTPIAGALAEAQLLSSMLESKVTKQHAESLVRALARLARLAERLLALARAEGGAPLLTQQVDLERVVRLVAQEFERDPRLAGRTIMIDARHARVRGDLDAIGLALRNLIENALEHAGSGATIRIVCGRDGNRATLVVADDGVGVPVQETARLVRRFTRGARAGGSGAGLGLSIVDNLARRMGARLLLQSPPQGRRAGFEARLEWSGASSPARADIAIGSDAPPATE